MAPKRMTERDRHIVSWLVIARCLSTAQLGELMTPGCALRTTELLLKPLAGRGPRALARPLAQATPFRNREGGMELAWVATAEGYALAEDILGHSINAADEVGIDFLEHLLGLNALLVAMAADGEPRASPGKRPGRNAARDFVRAHPLPFRWISSESSRLPWREYEMKTGRERARLIVPDATLELLVARRRVFIEYETGSHTVVPSSPDKPGATLAKAARYDKFATERPGALSGPTFYAAQFDDNFAPELLFLVPRASRRDTVNEALEKWRAGRGGAGLKMRALTIPEAAAEFRRAMGKEKVGGETATEMRPAG